MIDDLAELDLPAQDALRLSGLGGVRDRIGWWRALLDRPLTSYYLVLGITTLLLGLGLVMVQSTASVTDLIAGLSPYSDFKHQLLGAAVGIPLMWAAARSSPRLFRAFAYPLLAVSVVGLCLTLIHGVSVSENGAARWIEIGGQQIQPSEIAKLALAVWGADLLARKDKLGQLADWRHMLVPLMPGTAVLCLLVMAGDDLGTTLILLVIFLALLWVIGTPGRVFSGMLILMMLAMALMIVRRPTGSSAWSASSARRAAPPAPTCSPSRASTRSARAAGSAWASAPAGRSGAGCRNRPRTTSSPSSARNSGWSARCA